MAASNQKNGAVLKPQLLSKFEKIRETDDLEVYQFTPSLIKSFPFILEKLSVPYRIRCKLEYFVGYKVFYIRKNEKWVGYCIVSNGRNPRYRFCSNNDITFGRYFTSKEFRGQGIGKKMIQEALINSGLKYEKAYAYVHKGNKASHALLKSIGCVPVGHFDKVGRFRRIIERPEGSYTLYRYEQ